MRELPLGGRASAGMLHPNHQPGGTAASTRGRHRRVCTPGQGAAQTPLTTSRGCTDPWAGRRADPPRAGRRADLPHHISGLRRPPGQGASQTPLTTSRGRLPTPTETRPNPGLRVGMEGEPVSPQRQVGQPVQTSSTRGRPVGTWDMGAAHSLGPGRGGPCRGGCHGEAPGRSGQPHRRPCPPSRPVHLDLGGHPSIHGRARRLH